ncbi:MAG: hypothetical protein ACK4NM_07625 [Hydrogenophaga sp.]
MPNSEIDVAERHSEAAAAFSFQGVVDARQRAHALLLVLLAGGGGLGGLGLAQWSTQPILGAAGLGSSVFWFVLAAWLATKALTSESIRAWNTVGLLEKHEEWTKYADEVAQEGGAAVDVLAELRRSAIRNTELAANEYRAASTLVFAVVDKTLRWMSLTPVVCVISAVAVGLLRKA